jgi:butyrate kinase
MPKHLLPLSRAQICARCKAEIKHNESMINHEEMHHTYGTLARIKEREDKIHFYKSIMSLIDQMNHQINQLDAKARRVNSDWRGADQ